LLVILCRSSDTWTAELCVDLVMPTTTPCCRPSSRTSASHC